MNSFEKILIDTIVVNKGYNIHQLKNPTWVTKGKMIYAYTSVANLLAINETNDASYSDYIENGCFYNKKIGYSLKFLLNALVEKNLYLSRYYITNKIEKDIDQLVYKTIDVESKFDQGKESITSKKRNITLYWNESKFIFKNFF